MGFTTDANVSWKSTLYSCSKPQATHLALCHSGLPSESVLILNVYFLLSTLWFCGLIVTVQVLLLLSELVSSSIATLHFLWLSPFITASYVFGSMRSRFWVTSAGRVSYSLPWCCSIVQISTAIRFITVSPLLLLCSFSVCIWAEIL
jgi:hypothetical protein